jgi:threonine/homoserine/homoserine lactone efflux protein
VDKTCISKVASTDIALICLSVLVLYCLSMYSAFYTLATPPPPSVAFCLTCPMTASEFTALLLLATAMSFSPGPNTTLSTALAANHGMRHALRFVCAVPVGWGVLLSVCAAGVGGLIMAAPALRLLVKVVGVGYLLWLAYKLSRSGKLVQADASRLNVTFWEGAALQFFNIKAWMLALSIVTGWVAGRGDAIARFAVVLPTMMLFALVSNLAYASLGALLRDWLANGNRLLWFNRVMAAILVATAFWMGTVQA